MKTLVHVLLRLTAAGALCGALLSLGGSGARKEILRFCCACVMLILVLTALQGQTLPELPFSAYEAELDQTVEQARQETMTELLHQTQQGLAQEVVRMAAARGISCEAHVTCTLQEGQVTVTQMELLLPELAPAGLQQLMEELPLQLGITREQIVIREGKL